MAALAIRALDLPVESVETLRSLHDYCVVADLERWPDRDPLPFNESVWRIRSPFRERRDWVIEAEPGRIVALGNVMFGLHEQNRHVASAGISVHADFRRRGFGSALLAEIVAESGRQIGRAHV